MNIEQQAKADKVCWAHFPGVITRHEYYDEDGRLVGRVWRVEIAGQVHVGSYQECVDFASCVKDLLQDAREAA